MNVGSGEACAHLAELLYDRGRRDDVLSHAAIGFRDCQANQPHFRNTPEQVAVPGRLPVEREAPFPWQMLSDVFLNLRPDLSNMVWLGCEVGHSGSYDPIRSISKGVVW